MSKGKMVNFLNYRMKVTLQDGRTFIGQFMAFDKHLNLIIADCEEHRKIPGKKGQEPKNMKRTLGLVLIRGENVVSLTVVGPPPVEKNPDRQKQVQQGLGAGRAAGRGLPVPIVGAAQPGLSGPVRGVGGPAPGMMMPQMGGPPGFGRGAPPPGQPGFPPMGRGMAPPPMGRGGYPGGPPPGYGPPGGPQGFGGPGGPPQRPPQ